MEIYIHSSEPRAAVWNDRARILFFSKAVTKWQYTYISQCKQFPRTCIFHWSSQMDDSRRLQKGSISLRQHFSIPQDTRDIDTHICVAYKIYTHNHLYWSKSEQKSSSSSSSCNHVSRDAFRHAHNIHSFATSERKKARESESEVERNDEKIPFQLWAKSDSFVSNSNKFMCARVRASVCLHGCTQMEFCIACVSKSAFIEEPNGAKTRFG